MSRKKDKQVEETAQEFKEESFKLVPFERKTPIRFDKVLSTGSTLLDLQISGKRVRGGGIPGGIVVEVFGPPGVGKTAILAEVGASAQLNGGEVDFKDPEGRLDQEYAKIYGVSITDENYSRPRTVPEIFDPLYTWQPENPEAINVSANDSLAALSTDLELESGDKMGMRRAKEFSENLRKACVLIADNNWLMVCSNQIRQGQHGMTTPGGNAIPFYSSLRIQMKPVRKIERRIKVNYGQVEETEESNNSKRKKRKKKAGKELTKIIGVESTCFIYKSSIDDPFRSCPVYLLFGMGIDDVRGNLQWIKDITQDTMYDCFDKRYPGMEQAIAYIEENDLEDNLRNKVIDYWEDIENRFEINRKKKIRR